MGTSVTVLLKMEEIIYSQPEEIHFLYDDEAIVNISKSSGHNFMSLTKEAIDNSLESGADRVDISVLENEEYDLIVQDDGLGMSYEEVKTKFFKCGTSNNSGKNIGIHAGFGAKDAIVACVRGQKESKMVLYTHKEGCVPVKAVWSFTTDENGVLHFGKMTIEHYDDSKDPKPLSIGTKIGITKANAQREDAKGLLCFIGEVYNKELSRDKVITVNGTFCKPYDPLYWNVDCPNDESWTYTEGLKRNDSKRRIMYADGKERDCMKYEAKVNLNVYNDKGTATLRVRSFMNTSNYLGENGLLHPNDIDEDGKNLVMTPLRSGVYLYVDGILIFHREGGWTPYVNRKWHNTCQSIRIEMDLPSSVAKHLDFNINKSKGISNFGSSLPLRELRSRALEILEIFIQMCVNKNENEAEKNENSYEVVKKVDDVTEIRFTTDAGEGLSPDKFADFSDDGLHVTYNLKSDAATYMRKKPTAKNKFKCSADLCSEVYAMVVKSLSDCKSIELVPDGDLSIKDNMRMAKDRTLEEVGRVFRAHFSEIKL